MRIAQFAALIVTAISLFAKPASAIEGPWCAVISLGPGSIYEDCQYRAFEQCRPVVLAGNRGFCNKSTLGRTAAQKISPPAPRLLTAGPSIPSTRARGET